MGKKFQLYSSSYIYFLYYCLKIIEDFYTIIYMSFRRHRHIVYFVISFVKPSERGNIKSHVNTLTLLSFSVSAAVIFQIHLMRNLNDL